MDYDCVIVDGYCLLHREPAFARDLSRRLAPARQQVIRLVERICPDWAPRASVVFDGREGSSEDAGGSAGVTVFFSPPDQTADTVIERMVHEASAPQRILVVTSDRLETETVSAAGADVMSCAEFLDRTRGAPPTPRTAKRSPHSLGDYFP